VGIYDEKGDFRNDMSDKQVVRSGVSRAFIAVIALVILVFIIGVIGIVYNKTVGRENIKVNNQNEQLNVQGSPQYIAGQLQLARTDYTAWLTLDADIQALKANGGSQQLIQAKQAQQTALLTKIKGYVYAIPSNMVPGDIASFVNQH
jgi:cell division protein FtsN